MRNEVFKALLIIVIITMFSNYSCINQELFDSEANNVNYDLHKEQEIVYKLINFEVDKICSGSLEGDRSKEDFKQEIGRNKLSVMYSFIDYFLENSKDLVNSNKRILIDEIELKRIQNKLENMKNQQESILTIEANNIYNNLIDIIDYNCRLTLFKESEKIKSDDSSLIIPDYYLIFEFERIQLKLKENLHKKSIDSNTNFKQNKNYNNSKNGKI